VSSAREKVESAGRIHSTQYFQRNKTSLRCQGASRIVARISSGTGFLSASASLDTSETQLPQKIGQVLVCRVCRLFLELAVLTCI
ncbi:7283_t:CDS:1, partial [Acaulospora colombiana]